MAREVKTSGRTVYLPDREELEPIPVSSPTSNGSAPPNDVPPGALYPDYGHDMRMGPYALTVEVSGFVEHELRCSGCGEPQKEVPVAQQINSRHHFVAQPGGWRKCGEWR